MATVFIPYMMFNLAGEAWVHIYFAATIEVVLPSHLVCRVHKSYMVALNKIESIERNRIKIANQLLPISETYKDAFLQRINNSI